VNIDLLKWFQNWTARTAASITPSIWRPLIVRKKDSHIVPGKRGLCNFKTLRPNNRIHWDLTECIPRTMVNKRLLGKTGNARERGDSADGPAQKQKCSGVNFVSQSPHVDLRIHADTPGRPKRCAWWPRSHVQMSQLNQLTVPVSDYLFYLCLSGN
jgi:hypothetical protein